MSFQLAKDLGINGSRECRRRPARNYCPTKSRQIWNRSVRRTLIWIKLTKRHAAILNPFAGAARGVVPRH
jgi:hypothetical protein